jgi:mono/diheme cytochrome c family protein
MRRTIAVIGACCAGLWAQQQSSRSVWDRVYTDEQAKRGAPLYHEHCADCHGEELEGDAEAPALSGGTFLTNWNGLPLSGLFQRIRRDMPLNSDVGKLGPALSADILAYILKVNKFPPGSTELSHSSVALDQIRFEADKRSERR